MKTPLVSIIIVMAFSTVFAQNKNKHTVPKIITLTLKLDKKNDVVVTPAKLKYDKHLAYSFTVDDGYRSAYACAYPLFNGGTISPPLPDEWQNDQGGDGTYSEGLFFSDGCNNKIPFKLSLAINAGALTATPANRGHMSWPEVKQLYEAGWDLLNHGHYHRTKHGTNFHVEVIDNTNSVKKQLDFTMSQFVVPGGESDPGYEHEYEKYAFGEHHFAVASYKGAGPLITVDKAVNLDQMIYARHFLQNGKEDHDLQLSKTNLVTLDSIMKLPQPIWYNEFTHGVGNSNLWGLSMFFPEFKYYMTSIANKYGIKGSDNIWMAPWQEVYEYIWLRDRVKVNYKQKGKDILVTLEVPQIPESFRYRTISLKVDSASNFETTTDSASLHITTDGKTTHKLINIVMN